MINDDEWLVVIDRQEAFAHNEWSRWACSDGAYYQTDKNYTRLAQAYGDRVAYTRYIAPQPPKGAWVEYMKNGRNFRSPPTIPCMTSHQSPPSSPRSIQLSHSALSASGDLNCRQQ